MRFLGKSLSGLFFLALTLGLLVFAGVTLRDAVQARMNDEPRAPRDSERVFAVDTVTLEFGSQTPVLSTFGEVLSRRTLELRTAAGGRIVALDPDFVDGGRVAEGQVLARIDPAEADAALGRAESDVLDAQAERREADRAIGLAEDELSAARDQVALREQALQRQRDLAQRGVGTAAAVEAAELALSSARQAVLTRRQAVATARSRIDQARTNLRRAEIARAEAERRLSDTRITAGFAGTLADVTVVAGRLVSANEQLARLVDPSALEVAFRVSNGQYARLIDASGTLRDATVTVTLEVAGQAIAATGRLSREGAAVGEGQTGRLLFAELVAPAGLKPGDFVTVSIRETPLDRVARVPATAIDPAGNLLLIGDDNRLQSVAVTVLRRQGDDVLIRADGLDGRRAVAARTPLLGDGIKVRPIGGPEASAGAASGSKPDSTPGASDGPASGGTSGASRAAARTEPRSDGDGTHGVDEAQTREARTREARSRTEEDGASGAAATKAVAATGSVAAAGSDAAPGPADRPGAATIPLSDDRRARLRAHVRTDAGLPQDARARFLTELDRPRVPARTVSRIEARMGS